MWLGGGERVGKVWLGGGGVVGGEGWGRCGWEGRMRGWRRCGWERDDERVKKHYPPDARCLQCDFVTGSG